MSPLDASEDDRTRQSRFEGDSRFGSLETMLFESLTHHLFEKGLLSKNDALSIVQAVAQVKRGQVPESDIDAADIRVELALLERLYGSFEALRERSAAAKDDRDNVRKLRPPLHDDQPEFPHEV